MRFAAGAGGNYRVENGTIFPMDAGLGAGEVGGKVGSNPPSVVHFGHHNVNHKVGNYSIEFYLHWLTEDGVWGLNCEEFKLKNNLFRQRTLNVGINKALTD